MSTTVADIIVASLKQAWVKRIYGVVGDSLNGITDAIRRDGSIRWLHTRQEEVAAFAASREAAVTGSLAVSAGSCGPGNLPLIKGLFDANRSRVPVLAIAAHIPTAEIGFSYFQETHPESLLKECMLQIHPNARTTPVTRAEIARSSERSGTLAKRYGVSAETIRKWRKRGASECQDRSTRPHRLPWKATEEERAVVCAVRQSTNFPLDDLTFVIINFLPHLNRDSIWRILRSEGLSRRRPPASTQPARGQGVFKDYDLGFIHIDIKHLPKLRTANGETRKRYLYVAIDRRSRSAHLAVKDDETEKSAIAFLHEADAAFPFRLTHVLTDNGSCFTPAFERACVRLGAEYRHTRPRTPQTNGMVERFNGRIGSEVLGITIYSHRDLEQLLRGFNAAYNTRRQRVLDGKTPDQVVAERLKTRRKLSKPKGAFQQRATPCEITKARFIAETAKEVSQPDKCSRFCELLSSPDQMPSMLGV